MSNDGAGNSSGTSLATTAFDAFDVEAYTSSYLAPTLLPRLMHLAASPLLPLRARLDALHMAKAKCMEALDTESYARCFDDRSIQPDILAKAAAQDPHDADFVAKADAEAKKEQARLDADLNKAKMNLGKDNIRRAYEALAANHLKRSELQLAQR